MGLRQVHKIELKMKSICTNKKRRWLMQIGIKMVHKQVTKDTFT